MSAAAASVVREAPSAAARPAQREVPASPAFRFVQSLADELSRGHVEIPSFPDIALRVRKVLADDNATPETIVRVIGSEPALAARVLTLANSAALNPSGSPVTGLRGAVTRIGFEMLRVTVVTFSMAQLRRAPEFRGLEKPLTQLWTDSVQLAAYAQVLARRMTTLQPDAAMLTGLLHGIGKLYIITRASRHPELFADRQAFELILRDWHANIARAVLENWGMPEEFVEAVHLFEDEIRDPRGLISLTDVLSVAHLFVTLGESPARLAAGLGESRSAHRLQVEQGPFEPIIEEAQSELLALRTALGD